MTVSAPIIAYPVEAGGRVLRVLEIGDAGETVLFVHGAGARADRWRLNMPVIAAAGYRCLAIDLPGHGFAAKGAGFAYGVPAFADVVAALLDGMARDRVHLVGTSLGAHTLSEVALRRPDRVASLTLVGATGLFPIGPETRGRIADSLSDQSRAGIERKLRNVYLDPVSVDDAFATEEWRINTSPGAAEAFAILANYFRDALDDHVVGERLAALGQRFPIQVCWGDGDRTVPIDSGHRAAALLGCPLIAIPASAHAPYMENPPVFNAALLRFLRAAGPAQAD